MNFYLLAAGIIAALATIGHFSIGAKDFLKPVLNSGIDEIPKKVMQSLFHYMSVFITLNTIILLAFSFGNDLIFDQPIDVVKVIAITYAGFAVVQFFIALTSSLKCGIIKLFQWIFWALIATLSLVGSY